MLFSFLTDSLTISDVDEVIRSQLMDPVTQPTMPSIPVLQYTSKPCVRIAEQPAPRSLRFRYECEIEGRSAGSIVGINNTAENRTYPTIQVLNHQGPYAVVVSCVTKDAPYRPHPHNLVGREGCKRGVCTLLVNNSDMICSFTSLGIQCVKKRDIEKSLKVREAHNLDPFGTGFTHPSSIDLNVLRLCFQVFIRGPDNSFSLPLQPVVSEPIFDKKAMSDLTIMKLSHYSAPVTGGTEVILLCDRVAKEDIQVWFYEEQGSRILWESQAEFQPSDVHKQVAISFRTPRYPNEGVQQPVPVFVELRKPSENKRGEPRPFQFLPMERDPEGLARKKQKVEERIDLEKYFQGNIFADSSVSQDHQLPIGVPRMSRQQRVKVEPVSALGGACGSSKDPFARTSFSPSSFTSTLPICVPSPSHLTPVHSPNPLATSPQSSCTPPPPSIQQHLMLLQQSESSRHSPTMQQLLQQSESSQQHSPAMQQLLQQSESSQQHSPAMQQLLARQSESSQQQSPTMQQLLARQSESSQRHSPTMQQLLQQSESSQQHSPAMQQMLQQSESSQQHSPVMMMQLQESSQQSVVMEDAIIEKFDSIDLDDLNINIPQNLSASLFDSAPGVNETIYRDEKER